MANQRLIPFSVLMILIALSACSRRNEQIQVIESTSFKQIEIRNADVVQAQTLYVPIYAEIYFMDNNRKVGLTATLSIRNTDMEQAILISAVDYYDTMGKKLRAYLPKPIELGPLQTYEVIVEHNDNEGGTGANFIVQWSSYHTVSSPIAECIMINSYNSQGLSFTTQGKVIKEYKR